MKPSLISLVLLSFLSVACNSVKGTVTSTPEATLTPVPSPTATSIPVETVTFTTEDNVTLSGTLFGKGKIAVILAHQGTPGTDQTTWQTFARLLAEQGYTALTFDFRGVGQSEGTLGYRDLWKDVKAATQFLRELGYSQIVCAGASMGGTACIYNAKQGEYMGLIVLASTMVAGRGVDTLAITDEDLAKLTLPKLFISAERENYIVVRDTKHMAELSLEPKSLLVLPGTQHGTLLFDTDSGEKLPAAILEFIDNLKKQIFTSVPLNAAGSLPPLQVIIASNAEQVQLLKTLQIPGYKTSTLSQCSVVFSPDGKVLSGVCYRNTIPIWDVQSGQLLRSLESSSVHEVAVAFSPNGKQIATGGFADNIRLWDLATGQLIQTIDALTPPVWELAFSPNGDSLASANFNRSSLSPSIHLWNTTNGELLWDYKDDDKRLIVLSVDYSPDGKTLAYGTFDSALILDAEKGTLIASLPIPNHVGDLAFSPDGKFLATASDDRKIRIWETSNYELQSTLEGHTHYVNGVAFSPGGKLIVSSSHDDTVGIWDANTGQLLNMLDGHENAVLRVAVNPTGTLIASISWDGTVRLWGITQE